MSKTFTVSTAAELRAALSSASGGDTIELAAGNYGDLSLINGRQGVDVSFASNVTITSADPENPAVITGLDLRGGANLSFQNITFDYQFEAGDPHYLKPFSVSNSQGISFDNCVFDGDLAQGVSEVADGYGYGIGLTITSSTDVGVTNSEFFDFWKGAVIAGSQDVVVSGNDIHSMRMDGLNFVSVTDVLIENNLIHDFATTDSPLDHSDMIQFWTNGTSTPSTNIVIRGNHLDVGDGGTTQSIFMRNDMVDRGLAGSEMFYRNVLIENNVIVNAHLHGITVGETDGLTIRGNSVLHDDGGNPDQADASVEIPRINVATTSVNVSITQNLTAGVAGFTNQPGWVVTGNVTVQDQNPNAPGYYGDLFITSSYTGVDGLHMFRFLPDQLAALTGVGASDTWGGVTSGLQTQFQVSQSEGGSVQSRVFDAGLSLLNGSALPQGTLYLWTFGDGTTAIGRAVTHTFADGGSYDATLTVVLPGGTTGRSDATVQVSDSTLLRLNDNGRFVVSVMGDDTTLTPAKTADADGLHLGAAGTAAIVEKTLLKELFSTDEFEISLSLAADSGASQGEVFRIHGSILATVNRTGAFVVSTTSDSGQTLTLSSGGLKINDLAEHDIAIRLEDGVLELWMDGTLAASGAFDGQLATVGRHALVFGNPWGKVNFAGELSEFEISLDTGMSESTVLQHGQNEPATTAPAPVLDEDSFTALITRFDPRSADRADPAAQAAENVADALANLLLTSLKAQAAGETHLSDAYNSLMHGLDLSQPSDLMAALTSSDTLLL